MRRFIIRKIVRPRRMFGELNCGMMVGKRELVCEVGEGELSAVSRRLSCRSRGGIIRAYIGAGEKVDTLNGEEAGLSLVH